jgi:hypothetical protein
LSRPTDLSRFATLILLAGGVFLTPLAPLAPDWTTGMAWADDDDGDDDDGGDDDDDHRAGRSGGDSRSRSGGDRGSRSDDGGPGWVAPFRPRVTQGTPAPAPVPVPRAVALPDEIVALGLSAAGLDVLQVQGFTVIEERALASAGIVARRLRIPGSLTLEAARDLVRAVPGGEEADLNHLYRSEQGFGPDCTGPGCPIRTAFGWPLPDSRAEGCGAGLRVGMIDTGLNPDHETFEDAALHLVPLDTGPGQARSRAQHGTAIAALLVGDPATRSPGLIPRAEVLAVDAFHGMGRDDRADVFSLVAAMDLLAARDIDVLNLSLAGPPNSTLEIMIRSLVQDRDVVVVAAAGNAGPASDPLYPAALGTVIAVTAVDRDRDIYRRAVQGRHVDVAAPGVSVWTAASISGARPKTGTSFAVPFVTAAAGLLRLAHPTVTAPEIADLLRAQATDLGAPGSDPVFGAGLAPAANARCEVVGAVAEVLPVSAD